MPTFAAVDIGSNSVRLKISRLVAHRLVEIHEDREVTRLGEARLIHLGLTSNLRVNASPVLMIDLGGGSCELTVSKNGHIQETVSLPLGAVRLTNDFLHHDPPRKPELRQLRGFA